MVGASQKIKPCRLSKSALLKLQVIRQRQEGEETNNKEKNKQTKTRDRRTGIDVNKSVPLQDTKSRSAEQS